MIPTFEVVGTLTTKLDLKFILRTSSVQEWNSDRSEGSDFRQMWAYGLSLLIIELYEQHTKPVSSSMK